MKVKDWLFRIASESPEAKKIHIDKTFSLVIGEFKKSFDIYVWYSLTGSVTYSGSGDTLSGAYEDLLEDVGRKG